MSRVQRSISLLLAVVAWLHILFVIGWLGLAMILEIVLVPSLSSLSTQTSNEFVSTVFPRLARFHDIMSTGAVVFGASLLYVISGGDLSTLSPKTTFGLSISIGVGLGLTAFLLGSLVIIPSVRRVAKIVKKMEDSNRDESMREVSRIVNRIKVIGPAGMFVLILTLVFMVAAAYY